VHDNLRRRPWMRECCAARRRAAGALRDLAGIAVFPGKRCLRFRHRRGHPGRRRVCYSGL